MFTALKASFDSIYTALSEKKADLNDHHWYVIKPDDELTLTFDKIEQYRIDFAKESQSVQFKQYTNGSVVLDPTQGILYRYTCTNGKELLGFTPCKDIDRFINAIESYCENVSNNVSKFEAKSVRWERKQQ